jgi:hypothetical protein
VTVVGTRPTSGSTRRLWTATCDPQAEAATVRP